MKNPDSDNVVFPLHPLTVLLALVADWSLFAANLLTYLRALPWSVAACACAVGVATAVIERRLAAATWRTTTIKALGMAVLVAAPLPLLGTFLGGIGVVWAIAAAFPRESGPRTEQSKA